MSKVADTRQALELVASQLQQWLGAMVVILTRQGPAWTPVVSSHGSTRPWAVTSEDLSFAGGVRVAKLAAPDGTITAVQLSSGREGDPDLAFAILGEVAVSNEILTEWSLILSTALHGVRARETAQRAEQLLVSGFAMTRRLSRLNTVDSVGRSVVAHAARMLNAGRVSLALYRKADECLTIASTYGYPLSSVANVRIASGDWVIGHVYATRRPLFVRDVRALAAPAHPDRYRSHSFAAVPVMAGADCIGVLSVTDKHDDRPFGREDLIALRVMGVWAGTALASARTETEAARLAYAATIDSLTGLLNRTYLDGRLHQEIERAKRENGTLAVLIGDIDDFKSINDRWGHQVGDAVLEAVGNAIRSAVRVFDICARYGGDEFAIVMPNSDAVSAAACAERIRRLLAEYRSSTAEDARVTMSIGVAVYTPGDAASDLIARADRCMYQAKARDKNQVMTPSALPAATPIALAPAHGSDRAAASATPRQAGSQSDGVETPVTDLPYVLVADAREDRAAFCREAVSGMQRGLLITRDGKQALRAIKQFGTPELLIVDLALPAFDGFSVIDAVRADQRRRAPIVAWTSSRAMREYASSRLKGLDVRVIADTASPATMRAAIRRLLEPEQAAAPAVRSEPDSLRKQMADLANRAQQLCGTPGVAIYMRSPGDTKFRASFSWLSDDLMPHSPCHLPRAFERITQTGESIFARDVRLTAPAATEADCSNDAVRGLAGVPIVADRQVIGAICVFDTQPLLLDEKMVASLRALGLVSFDDRDVLWPPLPAPGFRDRAGDREVTASRHALESKAWVGDFDWPPSLLERQGGEFAVARERARARREGHQLSVVLFELAPGQNTGAVVDDESIETVTETLLRAIRQSDLPIRWSGSELLVVLPGLADHQARTVAERVRAALHAGARHRLAISGGVAELKDEERFDDVVERARQRVAIARGRGHNRVL